MEQTDSKPRKKSCINFKKNNKNQTSFLEVILLY